MDEHKTSSWARCGKQCVKLPVRTFPFCLYAWCEVPCCLKHCKEWFRMDNGNTSVTFKEIFRSGFIKRYAMRQYQICREHLKLNSTKILRINRIIFLMKCNILNNRFTLCFGMRSMRLGSKFEFDAGFFLFQCLSFHNR